MAKAQLHQWRLAALPACERTPRDLEASKESDFFALFSNRLRVDIQTTNFTLFIDRLLSHVQGVAPAPTALVDWPPKQ